MEYENWAQKQCFPRPNELYTSTDTFEKKFFTVFLDKPSTNILGTKQKIYVLRENLFFRKNLIISDFPGKKTKPKPKDNHKPKLRLSLFPRKI